MFVGNGKFQKSGVIVEFFCLGFRVLAPGNMNAEQLDSSLCNLYSLSHQQETKALAELQNCCKTFIRYGEFFFYYLFILNYILYRVFIVLQLLPFLNVVMR